MTDKVGSKTSDSMLKRSHEMARTTHYKLASVKCVASIIINVTPITANANVNVIVKRCIYTVIVVLAIKGFSTAKSTIVVAVEPNKQESKFTFLTFVARAKSTSSTNMADYKFLPVDALARQQPKRRALTAHSNFMVDNFVFARSSIKQ